MPCHHCHARPAARLPLSATVRAYEYIAYLASIGTHYVRLYMPIYNHPIVLRTEQTSFNIRITFVNLITVRVRRNYIRDYCKKETKKEYVSLIITREL